MTPQLEELIAEVESLADGISPVDALDAAVTLAQELAKSSDDLLNHFVQRAREAGFSWSEIGSRLGVTKQAAQQRWLPLPRGKGPFKRFTPTARRVIVFAQSEARSMKHNYLGTEHLLLGVLAVKGDAERLLQGQGITPDAVKGRILEIIGEGKDKSLAELPFTPRSKKVLELALREMRELGKTYISPEHILLGLLREGEGVAAQVLKSLGVSYDEIRKQVPKNG
jgi:hypothetical protein